MNTTKLKIERTNSGSSDFRSLTHLLDQELWQRYGQEQQNYDKKNVIEQNDTVIVIYNDNTPVACGCFKNYNEKIAEVKRMYVLEKYRGNGYSRLVLKELENWAAELGYHSLILETGKKQPEAISLYTKTGYSIIENYGQYKLLENSVCFEKRLI